MEAPSNRNATLIELFNDKDPGDYRAFSCFSSQWHEIDLLKFIEIIPNIKFSESSLSIRLRAAPEESIGLEDEKINELIRRLDSIYEQLEKTKSEDSLDYLTNCLRRGAIKSVDITERAEKLAEYDEIKRKQELKVGGIQR